MRLTEQQLQQFHADGYLVLPDLFTADELTILNQAREDVFRETTNASIIERKSGEVRTAMGLHERNDVFDKLVRHPRLVEPAQQILGPDLYIQQVKQSRIRWGGLAMAL